MVYPMNILRLVLVFIASQLIFIPVYGLEVSNNYMIYVYGSKTCPHCMTLAKYFIENNVEFTWFWIDDEENLDALRSLVNDIDITEGTPTSIVYVNGDPVAIVLGAITEDGFWESIINNPTETLKIYYGDKLFKEVITPEDFTNKYIGGSPASLDDLKELVIEPEADTSTDYIPTIGVAIAISALILYIYLRKR